ncbi:MAG: single-stranded DNA-binding protein [Cyanobacteriota bacterium]|nr:single-stranded DNA-binding protein [Cyanobacteriota bacterium]MDY6358409.1 single-stranded DNA-binding protein [Cyanobacteriota bacterium]MDY6364776.1 single-stranded DNA-binding protein [Cyanobacteriota bacterium]MDY6383824.1 single-stranded DNA-binding protein [Cyanobacteriota bacterium]
MSLAKAAVTGIVYKEPKTGYTQNNVAVSSFVINIGENDETLVRVISKRQSLSNVVNSLTKNQKVLVGGRLQTGVSKLDDGTEKKVFEIDAQSIEPMGVAAPAASNSEGDIMSFGEMDNSSSKPETEVLMDDGEIPF